jgi:nitrite reductase/ring-hydroxylating ferredoxin subunit
LKSSKELFVSGKFNHPRRPEKTGAIITIGHVGDVPIGCSATVSLPDGAELALFNINGEFYAVENFCPHRGAPLADGPLCGHVVECYWHGWRFDVRDGRCLTHTGIVIESYPVVIEGDVIKIKI